MKKYLNEKGISLMELLATLTLLSLVGVLVFGVLINSLNIFNHESDSSDVRQEANLISNQLTTFYKVYGNFEIEKNGDGVIIYAPDKSNSKESREYDISDYIIDVVSSEGESNDEHTSKDIKIIISEKGNLSNKFELNSNISRIKEG